MPFGIARFQSERFKLFGDVFDRKFFAFGARRASFEFIGGENFDVFEQTVGGDGVDGWLGR